MTLGLADVTGLTVDAAAARLRTGRVAVTSDGPVRLTFSHLRRGTRVLVNGRAVARAGRRGTAVVRLPAGRTPVMLRP
jgi:hypothetical protein